jgi:uncharacterized protein
MGWLDMLARNPSTDTSVSLAAVIWLLRARAGGSPLANQFFGATRAALSADQFAEAERRSALPLEAAS